VTSPFADVNQNVRLSQGVEKPNSESRPRQHENIPPHCRPKVGTLIHAALPFLSTSDIGRPSPVAERVQSLIVCGASND
jgi:hypothetical protein